MMTENEMSVPKVGDEVLVSICTSMRSDKKWTQVGNLIAARRDPIGLTCGTIEITKNLTAAENPLGWLSDDAWIGCTLAAVFNMYSNDWRATQPVCDRAKAAWCKAWQAELDLSK